MTSDEALKTIFGSLLTALGVMVSWLARSVLGSREALIVARDRLDYLEEEMRATKATRLTQESVREVVEEALAHRDVESERRRADRDKRLALELRQAVLQGANECQRQTREEMERMVPRIVREVLSQTRRHRPDTDAGTG